MISLVEYVRKHNLTSRQVALALGVSLSSYYKYRTGFRSPGNEIRRKIFIVFKGEVTGIRKAYDLFPKVK